MDNVFKRLARVEALANAQKSEMMDVMQKAYERACEARDEDEAARLARAIRNKLLDESDKEMTLDRLGLSVTSPIEFISSLVKVFSGAWAKYRQTLRDLPQQKGFPFNVTFPEAPTDEKVTA